MPRKEFESFTRLDASDVNTYLMDQSVMTFAGTAARGSAITTPVEGMVTYLEDSNTFEYWDSSSWGSLVPTAGTATYSFVQTIYYTSSGTFTKATYPWLRAIRVKCQGAGGSGGVRSNVASNDNGAGGGAGGYAESFITDIAGLDASVTVTRGAGAAGVTRSTVGTTDGSAGGNSSFGTVVIGNGGNGSQSNAGFGGAGGDGTGNVVLSGSDGRNGSSGSISLAGDGGTAHLGAGGQGAAGYAGNSFSGSPGVLYGGGGGGSTSHSSTSTKSSGAGANGIVIVELYA